MMRNLLIRSLDWLARLCYMAGRNRWIKAGVFACCVLASVALIWVRTERTIELSVFSLPPTFVKATLVNRYVRASGNLLFDAAYDVRTPLLGVFWQNARFVPMAISGSSQSLIVLDDGLPPALDPETPVTLVGKMLVGRGEYPDYYLKVMEPPSLAFYDLLAWGCALLIAGIFAGILVNSLVRRVDYAIDMPFGDANETSELAEPSSPFVLWFGSLGVGYGDVVLRQVPVTFRAIPAEARLVPAYYPDLWVIGVRRLRMVRTTTVATSYGALPAMRIEFEDERGLTRNGVVAASNRGTMMQMLDVLRFVGQ